MRHNSGDGGPAFPQHAATGNMEGWRLGMTLRDWFAGQALASRGQLLEPGVRYASDLAGECYAVADAMIKEREK